MDTPTAQELNKQLIKLTKGVEQQVSFPQTFFRGIIAGLGTALGASIVFGIVIALLAGLVRTSSDIPLLNSITEQLLRSPQIRELLDDNPESAPN